MQPERQLELVHFQITKRCNLHCWFCGQWGDKGSFAAKNDTEMQLEDWQLVINSLVRYAEETSTKPSVILWGGEPLLSSCFAEITTRLYDLGFSLGLITNGTLLNQYASLCRKAFANIYVSLDGLPHVHNAIRGVGVYEKVADNLKLLQGGNAKITLMTVLTPTVISDLETTLRCFEKLHPDEVLLQEMIALSADEVTCYQGWLQNAFGIKATDIDSWQAEQQPHYPDHEWYVSWLKQHDFPFRVVHLPHGSQTGRAYCLSPYRHMHVGWNGNVGFCTDFSDFTVGNVQKTDLLQLFAGEAACHFAAEVQSGNCVACEHCSWRNSESFSL